MVWGLEGEFPSLGGDGISLLVLGSPIARSASAWASFCVGSLRFLRLSKLLLISELYSVLCLPVSLTLFNVA
jgi:hypothetical protein